MHGAEKCLDCRIRTAGRDTGYSVPAWAQATLRQNELRPIPRCGQLVCAATADARHAQVIGAQHAGSMTIASTRSNRRKLSGRNGNTAC